jgi:hypothetical protein
MLSSDQHRLACWGQAGLFVYAELGDGTQTAVWQQISADPALSAVAVKPKNEGDACSIVFSLADGQVAIASVGTNSNGATDPIRASMGTVSDNPQARMWISSASEPNTDDSINVLAYRTLIIEDRTVLELLALQLTLPCVPGSSESPAVLKITVYSSWVGSAVPRASYWHGTSEVLVVAMGGFRCREKEVAAPDTAMDITDEHEHESKRHRVEEDGSAENMCQAQPNEQSDAVILTLLSLPSSLQKEHLRSWLLPRGELLGAAAEMPGHHSGHGDVSILLERGNDALAVSIAVSEAEGSILAPAIVSTPRRIPGLASVASARQNLRLSVFSPQWTFIALCELCGPHAACIFRAPMEDQICAPTCSATLGRDEDVIGACLSETALCILTPHRVVRVPLDASVTIPSAMPRKVSGKLPGGIDAAALLRMLDKMEE